MQDVDCVFSPPNTRLPGAVNQRRAGSLAPALIALSTQQLSDIDRKYSKVRCGCAGVRVLPPSRRCCSRFSQSTSSSKLPAPTPVRTPPLSRVHPHPPEHNPLSASLWMVLCTLFVNASYKCRTSYASLCRSVAHMGRMHVHRGVLTLF